MEVAFTESQRFIAVAVGIVVASFVSILVFRMTRAAWTLVSDEVTRARLRRVYVCFALFGGLVLAALWALAQPWERGQGASALVGMFLGVPLVCIAGPIALYNSVMLWRVTSVRGLWTIVLLFVLVTTAEERLGTFVSVALQLGCALSTIVLASLGLIKGRVNGRGHR